MSNIPEQVEKLIETGPQQGIPPVAIAPIAQMLATVAQDLEQLQYYALRDRQQGWWLISTGAEQAEKWVAVFGHRADAERMLAELENVTSQAPKAEDEFQTSFEVVEKGVIELLFLALGMRRSAGLLVYEAEGDAERIAQGLPISGQGIRAEDLRTEMKRCLEQFRRSQSSIA
ncbi:MAG: hypothetical protein AB4040_14990 [Synechococcus sp.]